MIDLEPQGTEPTASAAPRCPSSTRRPVTCALANSCWVTGSWRAPSDTSASRWTTPGDVRADRSVTHDRARKRAWSLSAKGGLAPGLIKSLRVGSRHRNRHDTKVCFRPAIPMTATGGYRWKSRQLPRTAGA